MSEREENDLIAEAVKARAEARRKLKLLSDRDLTRMLNDYAEFYKQARRVGYSVRLETDPKAEPPTTGEMKP